MLQNLYHTTGIFPKSYRNIVQTDLEAKPDTPIPHMYIHNRLLPWLGTGTSIKSGGVKVALWDQTYK